MSGQNVVSDADLLAYARGELDDERARRVRLALKDDEVLRAELSVIAGVGDAGAGQAAAESPGSFGWARLSRSIDADLAETSQTNGAGGSSLSGGLLTALTGKRFAVWQVAACAAAAAALWHAIAGVTPTTSQTPAFVPASATGAAAQARVTFAPSASEAQIRALILDVEAEIVSGPSAVGLYTLQFDDEGARATGVDTLKAARDIVKTAQPG